MAVYDDEKQKSRGNSLLAGNEDLRHITGISPDEEQTMDREATSGAARDILDRERAAATGKDELKGDRSKVTAGGTSLAGGLAGKAANKLTGARDNLNQQEKSSLFNPTDDDSPRFSKLKMRRKLAVAGLISSLVGMGGGIGLSGYISGPLQFIHASRLLTGFHLDNQDDQIETRLMTSVRYIRAYNRGTPENSRLGYLANKVADRAERRFNVAGFKSTYGSLGVFRGYAVDPAKLQGGTFDKFKDRTPQGLQAFLKSEYGINSEIRGSQVFIDSFDDSFSYRINQRLTKHIQLASGANRLTSAVNARYAGQRTGMGSIWHPVRKLDRKIHDTSEKLHDAWKKRRQDAVEKGSGSVKPAGVEHRTDEEGEPIGSGAEDESIIEETISDAEEAHNDPQQLQEFRDKLTAKISSPLSAIGLVEVMCLFLYMADHIDVLNRANIEDPSARFGMEFVALGGQVTSGIDLDGETDQLGWYQDVMYDKEDKSTFFDALSIRRQLGLPGGQKIPEELRVDPEDNLLARIFSVPGLRSSVQTACSILESAVGVILLTGVSLAAAIASGGVASAVITSVLATVGTKLLVDFIVNRLAGKEVDVEKLAGANAGGVADQGVAFFGNNIGMSNGGLPLTEVQAAALREQGANLRKEEFKSKSLAYRLLSPDDPYSFMGQVIQRQRPDPAANIAMYATGFLDIGKTFGSWFARPLMAATVGAQASTEYDYGQPLVAFSVDEMQDKDFEQGDANEAKATELLDNDEEEPSFVQRAKVCFGVTLEKRPLGDPEAPDPNRPVWSINAPSAGEQPLIQTVLSGRLPASSGDNTDYRCMDRGDSDWQTIRFFIIDTQAMNSYVCYEGAPEADLTKQACIDIGMDPPGGYPDQATINILTGKRRG